MRNASWARTLLASSCVLFLSEPLPAENPVGDPGLYVSVRSPLTTEDVGRIKKRVDEARSQGELRPAKVVFDFTPDGKPILGVDFDAAFGLARYISELRDVQTIGYLRQKVSGHAAFPLLACQEIVMGKDAALGEIVASGEAPLAELLAENYRRVLGPIRQNQLPLVRKMYDPAATVIKVEKPNNGGIIYADARDRASVEKLGRVETVTLSSPALLSLSRAQELGVCKAQADSREELAFACNIALSTLGDELLTDKAPVAFRLSLSGKIDQGVRESVGRTIRDVIRQKGNRLFLQLDCAGGDMTAARGLADDIMEATRKGGADGIEVIAFIPDSAPDTAAVVAMGCSKIVLSRRKDATTAGGDPEREAIFGDFEAYLKGKNLEAELSNVRELAEKQGYSTLVVEAMFRRDLELVRVHDKIDRNRVAILTPQELENEKNKGKWVIEGQIKGRGQLLKMTATQAQQLGFARGGLVDTRDPNEVYKLYNVEGKVREATPAWLDRFAAFLRYPEVTVILVIVGFTGLLLELKVPGTTIPGIIAALCFIMVFWAHTQFSGQMVVLAGLLFLLGLVLILLEVFVFPGFGAAGVFGILLMLASLGLVTVEEVPRSGDQWIRFGSKMAQYMFGLIAAVLCAFFLARFLPKMPLGRQLALAAPENSGADDEKLLPGAALAASLLGVIGDTTTVLRPAGTVQFGEQFIDVVSEGGYIPAGTRVQVIEVEGTRIVVKEV